MSSETKSKCSSSAASPIEAELLAVPLSPSEKEVVKQAAAWRSVDARSLINLGLKQAAGTGGPVPSPTVHKKLLDLSAKTREVSEALEDHLRTVKLRILRLELLIWEGRIRAHRHKRKQLWDEAARETSTEIIWARLDGEESAHLQEKSRQADIPPKVLLRRGLLQALSRQREMKDLEFWVGRWAERAHYLHEESTSSRSGRSPQGWEKMAEIGEEIDMVVRDDILHRRLPQ